MKNISPWWHLALFALVVISYAAFPPLTTRAITLAVLLVVTTGFMWLWSAYKAWRKPTT